MKGALYSGAPAFYNGKLNGVFKLPDIARSMVVHQQGHGFIGNVRIILMPIRYNPAEKMVNKKRYIVFSLSDRRQVDGTTLMR